MAETIKDVVVKIRLEVDKAGDLRKAAETAGIQSIEKAQTDAVQRVKAVRKEAADQQTKTIREQTEELRKATDKEIRMTVAADRLKAIRMQERLAAFKRMKAEEARIEAEKNAGPGFGAQARGAASSAMGFLQSTAINILAARIVIQNAEEFLKGAADAIRKEIAGRPGDDGPITGITRGVASSLDDLMKAARDLVGTLGPAQQKIYDVFVSSSGISFILERMRNAGLIDGKVTRRIGGRDELGEGIELNRRLNEVLLERTKAERAIVDEERKRIDSAREEFGLMDAGKKQAITELAQRVGRDGIGALTPEQLDFVRGNQAFRGILSDQAKQQADAAGFDAVIAALGIDKKIADAQAKIDMEVKNAIDVKIDSSNDLAKVLEERLAPLLRDRDERILQQVKVALDKSQREAAARQNVGF